MKHVFERVSTVVERCAIVQVFDEQMFDMLVVEVLMSASYVTTTAVSYRARCERVEDTRLATVRDIATAPSARRRLAAQRMDDPSFLRVPVPPRRRARSSGRALIAGALATLVLSVGAGALGVALRGAPYDGPMVTKVVVAGDSVWSLAQSVKTTRPLDEVVADIERANDLEGMIQPGQRILVPLR